MPREEWLQTFRTVLDFCGEWHIIKVQKKEWYFPSFSPKQKKTPSRSCRSERGSSLFSAYGPWTIRQATCRCSKLLHLLRQTVWKKGYFPFFSPPLPNKWAGKAAKPLYHSFRQKDTGDAMSRTFLQRKGSVFVQPLSLLRSPAPLVGPIGASITTALLR